MSCQFNSIVSGFPAVLLFLASREEGLPAWGASAIKSGVLVLDPFFFSIVTAVKRDSERVHLQTT